MNVSARGRRGARELLEVEVQVRQRVLTNLAAAFAPCFPVAQRLAAVGFGGAQLIDGEANRSPQELVVERSPGARPQIALVNVYVHQAASGAAPSARSSSC